MHTLIQFERIILSQNLFEHYKTFTKGRYSTKAMTAYKPACYTTDGIMEHCLSLSTSEPRVLNFELIIIFTQTTSLSTDLFANRKLDSANENCLRQFPNSQLLRYRGHAHHSSIEYNCGRPKNNVSSDGHMTDLHKRVVFHLFFKLCDNFYLQHQCSVGRQAMKINPLNLQSIDLTEF